MEKLGNGLSKLNVPLHRKVVVILNTMLRDGVMWDENIAKN